MDPSSTPAAASRRRPSAVVHGPPPVRHEVAREEVADVVRRRRPRVADHLDVEHRRVAQRAPGLEHGVDDGVELLLGRVPRLQQVVVDVDDVDRRDRRVGVRVGGEQSAPGPGEQVHGLLEELDAVQPGHPVVGEDRGDGVAAELHLAQSVEGLLRILRAHDPVVLAVPAAQVPGDRPGDGRVVVDGHEDGPAFRHDTSVTGRPLGRLPPLSSPRANGRCCAQQRAAAGSSRGRDDPAPVGSPVWACRSRRAS